MAVYQMHEQIYQFDHLPAYATYLLKEHLEDYVHETIRLSREVSLPLLQHLTHLNEAELFQFSKTDSIRFLTYLSENRAKQLIEESLQRWLSNNLPLIGKYDVDAQDITIINYLRARVLKHWLPVYASDVHLMLQLNREIDDLKLIQNTTFANSYIRILKERIEEELHFSQNLINASPGITYIFDLKDQKISYINGKVEAVMGYSIQEVLGKETNLIADFIHPEDHPAVTQLIKSLMEDQQGNTYQAEFRIINKQEGYDWLRSYCVVYKRDEVGTPLQVLASGYKINEEKETAIALLKQEKQLLEAQAIAHIGSFEWDIINDVSQSSPELHKIFESDAPLSLEEMLEQVHPEDKRKLHIALQKAFVSGKYACEFRYLAKSSEKVVDSRGVITYNTGGEPVLMTGTVQDITERKQIEENLLKKTLQLERSNVQLQEFASIASHDLKEPVRKVANFSDAIVHRESKTLSEKTKIDLQKITDAALRMQQLIDGILSYSSVDYEGQKQQCSLEAVLQEVLTNLEFQIKEKNAQVTTDGLPEAEVVPVQIQQVFQNLITNALKFSKEGIPTQITISHKLLSPDEVQGTVVQSSGRYLQIQVSDNGIGFDREAKDKIFGLFQRLHSRAAYGGSGLGLAICRRIVESHGGTITADAQPGKGATFLILLPV